MLLLRLLLDDDLSDDATDGGCGGVRAALLSMARCTSSCEYLLACRENFTYSSRKIWYASPRCSTVMWWHPSVRLSSSVHSSSDLPIVTAAPVSSSCLIAAPPPLALQDGPDPGCLPHAVRLSILIATLGTCGLIFTFGMSITYNSSARNLVRARVLIKGVNAPLNPLSRCARVLVTLVQLSTPSNSATACQSSALNAHPGLNCTSYARRARFRRSSEWSRPCTAAILVVL